MEAVDTFIKYATVGRKFSYLDGINNSHEYHITNRRLLHIENGYSISTPRKKRIIKDYLKERSDLRKSIKENERYIIQDVESKNKPIWTPQEQSPYQGKKIFTRLATRSAAEIYQDQVELNRKKGEETIHRYYLIDQVMLGIFDWQQRLKEKSK